MKAREKEKNWGKARVEQDAPLPNQSAGVEKSSGRL